MTLEQLVKRLEGIDSIWGLSSVGIPAVVEGLKDAAKRIAALEKAAKPK
jgi:hypothetical protein